MAVKQAGSKTAECPEGSRLVAHGRRIMLFENSPACCLRPPITCTWQRARQRKQGNDLPCSTRAHPMYLGGFQNARTVREMFLMQFYRYVLRPLKQ